MAFSASPPFLLYNMEVKEYESPAGVLLLAEDRGRLALCDWRDGRHKLSFSPLRTMSVCIDEAIHQLDEYFAGIRREFSVPLIHHGTDFQLRVWEELYKVPYGVAISYKALAERIGRPMAVRAVANAVGSNQLSIFCPCHRIIGSNGRLTGYDGGIEAKQYLLALEKSVVSPTGLQ